MNTRKTIKKVSKRMGPKSFGLLIIFAFITVISSTYIFMAKRTKTFTLVVQSDTSWHGSFGTIEEGFTSVQGEGGKTFYCKGSICTAVIQKKTRDGYLQVSIYLDGMFGSSQITRAEYGVVTISAGG